MLVAAVSAVWWDIRQTGCTALGENVKTVFDLTDLSQVGVVFTGEAQQEAAASAERRAW